MRPGHALEALAARGMMAGFRAASWRRSLDLGAALGDGLRRVGLRRRVAEDNLERAFPDRGPAERAAILRAHYRELGRIVAEYARLGELARLPLGEVIAEVRGMEHLHEARAQGRGAVLMSGHFGNFELLGAFLGQTIPMEFVVQPLSNPGVEAMISRQRQAAGIGQIPLGAGVRRVFQALRANCWVAMLADQDARGAGVFVPFMGRPASTPIGPARIALAAGAPLILGFVTRHSDGRHFLQVEPPLTVADAELPDAAERLTAAHVARLEHWVRARPEQWFWLHRRWKTAPPADSAASPQRVRSA